MSLSKKESSKMDNKREVYNFSLRLFPQYLSSCKNTGMFKRVSLKMATYSKKNSYLHYMSRK